MEQRPTNQGGSDNTEAEGRHNAKAAEERPERSLDASEDEPTPAVRIYVASLSDYNAGILHGTWIDPAEDIDDVEARIDAMLAGSPTTKRYGEVAEEWAIHDYEGVGRHVALAEYESLERVHQLASGVEQFGEAFEAWWSLDERDDEDSADVSTQFEQQYIGEFSSDEEYAEQFLDDMGVDLTALPGVPEMLRAYISIDTAGLARDMVIDGSVQSVEGGRGVFLFWGR